MVPLSDNNLEARLRLGDFGKLVARKLPKNCSADAYLYWYAGQLHLGVTMFESSTTRRDFAKPTPTPVGAIWEPGDDFKAVDSVSLFKANIYVSGIHGAGTAAAKPPHSSDIYS